MAITEKTIFSEFELEAMALKFAGEEAYKAADCVGACEENLDVRIIKKKCRGITVKEVVRGSGTGKLKIKAHMPYELYCEMYGMSLGDLKTGIKAYGVDSVHKAFSMTQLVKDEDGNKKFKAYPNCIMETGPGRKIENGAEEVAELEFEVSVMPDENGIGMYEALESELASDSADLKTNWMTKFTPALAKAGK